MALTRREALTAVLETNLSTLKESLGAQKYADLIKGSVDGIVDLSKEKDEVVHVIGPNGKHRLIVNGESSEWKNQNEICRQGDYIAATDFFYKLLPQVGKIKEMDSTHFMTVSAQNLNMVPVRYSLTPKE